MIGLLSLFLLLPTGRAELSTAHRAAPAAFPVHRYELNGNTLLEQGVIDQAVAGAIGEAVTLDQVFKVLARLYSAYRERGFAEVSVSIPQQEIERGIVVVKVVEGDAARTVPKVSPETQAAKALAFEVRQYEISGNTLLGQETVDRIFTNAIGPAVTLDQVRTAAGKLQLAYRERGYVTVAVNLPAQQITNATIKVDVTEGKLSNIRIAENRYFSSNNIMRSLPSLRTNVLLNGQVFQRELDAANQNRDRQIYPEIGPGPEPGTSALTLRVADRLPLHARMEINNYATPGTPEWRINSSAQYNNLWQHEHQIGLSYGFSPEQFKSGGLVSDYFFNRPLIAYYGAYYRLPFGTPKSVAERINDSAGFGYDEATHQFRLPPAEVRPDLTFFASGSSSDTGIKLGPAGVVSQTPLLTIVSQDSGQNISINESAGGRLNVPVSMDNSSRRLSFSGGADVKRYALDSFNTNNFIITTVVTNTQGSQTIESRVASPQPSRHDEVVYLPLAFAADFSETDLFGTITANLGLSYNFLGSSGDFAPLAYSRKAKSDFGKATLSMVREQKVFKSWQMTLRASGQAATGPLISNEQFALGGFNSVRGYFEGDEYGDAGWFASVEAWTPLLGAQVPTGLERSPVFLRGSIFLDLGQRFLLDTAAGADPNVFLWGTGIGISGNINNHLDMRIVLGWPLADSGNTDAGKPHAYFSLGGQF